MSNGERDINILDHYISSPHFEAFHDYLTICGYYHHQHLPIIIGKAYSPQYYQLEQSTK